MPNSGFTSGKQARRFQRGGIVQAKQGLFLIKLEVVMGRNSGAIAVPAHLVTVIKQTHGQIRERIIHRYLQKIKKDCPPEGEQPQYVWVKALLSPRHLSVEKAYYYSYAWGISLYQDTRS
jgi:hypothetical protein